MRVADNGPEYVGKVLPNYTMLFDAGKKCALWVAFEMSASYPDSNVGRNEAWVADPAINASWQLNGSYGSAYSKGHQVASGDRQTSTDQNKQTFYYSNMTPQLQDLNGTTWATLENDIQKLGFGLSGSTRLFVVTGPLFEGSTSTTNCGTNGTCPVPTGYFKCIMRCTFDASGVHGGIPYAPPCTLENRKVLIISRVLRKFVQGGHHQMLPCANREVGLRQRT